jgi:hypothetical protein
MPAAKSLPALVAGLLFLDLLINLPGLSAASPVVSLLAPSIDLLVVAAALVGISQASEQARVPLRIVMSILLAALLCYKAAARFGVPAIAVSLGFGSPVAGYALGMVVCLAAAALVYFCSPLVLGSFSFATVRSLFIVVVALLAVLQVVSRHRIFEPSAIPRLVRDVGSLFR